MNVEYLSIIFADFFTLRNLSTLLHFVQTRYAARTFIRISWKQRKRLLHINEELELFYGQQCTPRPSLSSNREPILFHLWSIMYTYGCLNMT